MICDDAGNEIQRTIFNEVKISTRIGSVPRKLNFPNFSSFETDENELIDQLIRSRGKSTSLIHRLEGKLHFIFLAGNLWATLFVGLPFLAKTAAEKLPNGLLNEASQSTLDALDYLAFEPSQLPRDKQVEIISMINASFS